jgi:dTMP kinase
MIIAIEGIDGAGKGTQARLLADRLRKWLVAEQEKTPYKDANVVSFPRYNDTVGGRLIGSYLKGAFGSLEQVNPLLASLLYALDRFQSKRGIKALEEQLCSVVVCDRYVHSNIAYQCAKVSHDKEKMKALANMIETIEHDVLQIKPPDLVILLDIPASVAQARAQARDKGKAKDIHQDKLDYLQRVSMVYRYLSTVNANWVRVQCVGSDAQLRSTNDISDEIFSKVIPCASFAPQGEADARGPD